MTDIISPYHLQALRLDRIVYCGLNVTPFDHYSYYEYFATFIKMLKIVHYFVCLSLKIFNCHPQNEHFLVYKGM